MEGGVADVVGEVCAACGAKGMQVSEVLAAFVTRTILESHPNDFALDQELEAKDVHRLVDMATARLLARDSPSLETIKMQVGFDSSYVRLEDSLSAAKGSQDARLKAIRKDVLSVRPKDGSDFEALTGLYRMIFNYLLAYLSDDQTEQDRAVEREVAAALESVFPRIGLKSFVNLTPEEKSTQLEEMSRIVLGIRLFNREIGKGGAGLRNTEEEVYAQAMELRDTLEKMSEECQDVCMQYQDTLVYSHVRQPGNVTEGMVERWREELANRRQFLSYLQSLLEDVLLSVQKIEHQRDRFLSSIDDLQSLVGGRSSVPKEHVYPKFESAAEAFMSLWWEAKVVKARKVTLKTLLSHNEGFHATLSADSAIVTTARAQMSQVADEEENAAALALMSEVETGVAHIPDVAEAKGAADGGVGGDGGGVAEGKDAKDRVRGGGAKGEGGGVDRPVKLSIESTPEFMQLPLEYQGFCPWTMVTQHGLLLPGKPALGVVRYDNRFFVFANGVALDAFMQSPEKYRSRVLQGARDSPELIHLLRLQDDFPNSAISKLLNTGDSGDVDPDAVPEKKDAATETPLHFVEKHIDVNYEWNEWALRRRALRMTSIRKCKTTSQQTDASHFRRENDSQVYLPRSNVSQTMREAGTQPHLVTQYVAGLRGTSTSLPSKHALAADGKPGVVNLVLEPGVKQGHRVVGGRSKAF